MVEISTTLDVVVIPTNKLLREQTQAFRCMLVRLVNASYRRKELQKRMSKDNTVLVGTFIEISE